ncbi:MAG TPA: hypothetical protein VLK65_32020 [Vicinamibacteria bacterium]|nr:hypothetical protein [Vicinamibacteria bacterium]
MVQIKNGHRQPRLVHVRKPIRPVRVAAERRPIKVVAPIVPGRNEPVEAR